jgi:hypothetical protein
MPSRINPFAHAAFYNSRPRTIDFLWLPRSGAEQDQPSFRAHTIQPRFAMSLRLSARSTEGADMRPQLETVPYNALRMSSEEGSHTI